ncbi:hypothetical protein ACJMK2_044489 [Sinanodonta woodiana]|uniref:Uncharacterized protein n=1 Tax=Sinanodonta woodiana TaxID=1069815 RepID=A0ABD3W079_SINWO
MVCCGSASGWAKVACLLLVIALPLHIAGYATVYWLSIYTVAENYAAGIGLWKMENCSNNAYSNPCQTNQEVPASYKNVTFSMIGMIIHVTNIPTNHYVNYSFGLTVFAFLLAFLAGVLMFADIRRYGLPDSDMISVAPAPEKSKLDEVRNTKYYNEYGRDKDTFYKGKEREAYHNKHRTDVTHYHNPNRDPYERDRFVSPPPSYRSIRSPVTPGRMSPMSVRTLRTHVQTPDVYLGRNDLADIDRPRRY